MLLNPFTPSRIVGREDEFFGRTNELMQLDRYLHQGSLIVQGPTGIGKSSLVARIKTFMEGNESAYESKIIMCVSHSDITNVDAAGRLVLEELCDIDEKNKKIVIKFPEIGTYESSKAYNYFSSGRYLSSLSRIMENKSFIKDINKNNFIIIAIDECDKSPKPIAKLVRQILTKTQLSGITNIRFLLSGISPFYETMLEEDAGIARFILKPFNLTKLNEHDSRELVENKFSIVVKDAKENSDKLDIDVTTIERILSLANGHPHLLQLLGSHIIESENENPDGIINSDDLVQALNKICYENRVTIYDNLLRELDMLNYFDSFEKFIELGCNNFPTKVDKTRAHELIEKQALMWFLKKNYIVENSNQEYELVDEFLRVRMHLDKFNRDEEETKMKLILLANDTFNNMMDNDLTEDEMLY